jgi:hypothetical protein
MRARFVYFIIFQLVAWTFYFNWEDSSIQESITSQKLVKVAEVSSRNVSYGLSDNLNYELILRNDGFFTRLNAGRVQESGLWKINYEEPSIILTSAKGEYHYRILEQLNDRMEVRLVKYDDLTRKEKEDELDLSRLFSSSSMN